MAYRFQRIDVNDFVVFVSNQFAGDTHTKTFLPGVTPSNQATLNVYVAGTFRIDINGFSQTMEAGSTSLDLAMDDLPNTVPVVETVVSPTATRYCISSKKKVPWSRTFIDVVGSFTPPTEGMCVVMSGTFNNQGVGSIHRCIENVILIGEGRILWCSESVPSPLE